MTATAHETTHYHVLGVERTATRAQIRKAYHALALECHPDKVAEGQPEATQRFQLISEAYAALEDEDRRAAYDRDLERGLRRSGSQHASHHKSRGPAPPMGAPDVARQHSQRSYRSHKSQTPPGGYPAAERERYADVARQKSQRSHKSHWSHDSGRRRERERGMEGEHELEDAERWTRARRAPSSPLYQHSQHASAQCARDYPPYYAYDGESHHRSSYHSHSHGGRDPGYAYPNEHNMYRHVPAPSPAAHSHLQAPAHAHHGRPIPVPSSAGRHDPRPERGLPLPATHPFASPTWAYRSAPHPAVSPHSNSSGFHGHGLGNGTGHGVDNARMPAPPPGGLPHGHGHRHGHGHSHSCTPGYGYAPPYGCGAPPHSYAPLNSRNSDKAQPEHERRAPIYAMHAHASSTGSALDLLLRSMERDTDERCEQSAEPGSGGGMSRAALFAAAARELANKSNKGGEGTERRRTATGEEGAAAAAAAAAAAERRRVWTRTPSPPPSPPLEVPRRPGMLKGSHSYHAGGERERVTHVQPAPPPHSASHPALPRAHEHIAHLPSPAQPDPSPHSRSLSTSMAESSFLKVRIAAARLNPFTRAHRTSPPRVSVASTLPRPLGSPLSPTFALSRNPSAPPAVYPQMHRPRDYAVL